ncbi:MAG: TadE/TadG family type IV pilus assembly protein [Planctomycetota bacterium]
MQPVVHRNRRARSTQRRGVALVMFAMLVFAFMGIAALCIDMGMASLTQAQMQNAVDTAALEGVGSRDFFDHRPGANLFRRRLVRESVRLAFDDDLNVSALDTTEDEYQYRAGPIFRLEGGIESVPNASALIVVPESIDYSPAERYVDDPDLRENRGAAGDLPNGDMVAGTYRPLASHVEQRYSYLRDDFASASESDSYPEAESWKALSFLVRMRRTREFAHPSNSMPGVSSAGPPIPFLFGLGSTIHAADNSDYDPRRDGISVRATAIASGLPVLSVGTIPFAEDCSTPLVRRWAAPALAQFPRLYMGTSPVALRKDFWIQQLPDFTEESVFTDPTDPNTTFRPIRLNPVTGELTCEIESGVFVPAGRVHFGNSSGCRYGDMTHVGQSIDPATGVSTYSTGWAVRLREWVQHINTVVPGSDTTILGKVYVPIYTSIQGRERIVGFTHATFRFGNDADPSTAVDFSIQKGFPDGDEAGLGSDPACAVLIAPENASTSLPDLAPNEAAMSAAEWDLVFGHLLHLTYLDYPEPPAQPPANWVPSSDWRDVRNGALLAPALVR